MHFRDDYWVVYLSSLLQPSSVPRTFVVQPHTHMAVARGTIESTSKGSSAQLGVTQVCFNNDHHGKLSLNRPKPDLTIKWRAVTQKEKLNHP